MSDEHKDWCDRGCDCAANPEREDALAEQLEGADRLTNAAWARLALAEAYIGALEQNLNDFVDLKTMDEAIAWRAANRESVSNE